MSGKAADRQGDKPFRRRLNSRPKTLQMDGQTLTIKDGDGTIVLTGDARLYRWQRRWWVSARKGEIRLTKTQLGG